MLTSDQLARQIAVYSVIAKTKNVAAIAQNVGLSALQITNAIFAGERLGLFTVKRDKRDVIEKIDVTTEQFDSIALTPGNFGEAVENLVRHMLEFVENRNSLQHDVEEYSLISLARVPDVMSTVAVEVLKASGTVHVYPFADPLDAESVYTYYTLPANKDQKWCRKDFKTTVKKKKK